MAKFIDAVLKDVKVTKNGVTITFEKVNLEGARLQEVADLVSENVLLTISSPQLSMFDYEEPNKKEEKEGGEQLEVDEKGLEKEIMTCLGLD